MQKNFKNHTDAFVDDQMRAGADADAGAPN
jgi:hypothetical protein